MKSMWVLLVIACSSMVVTGLRENFRNDPKEEEEKEKEEEEEKKKTPPTIEIMGDAGTLESIKASTPKDAVRLFQSVLRDQGLIADGKDKECTPCVPNQPAACCFFWKQDGARLQDEPNFNLSGAFQIHFRLDYEQSLDPDLVQTLHELPFNSAADRREFGQKLKDKGIFKASQLPSVRASELPKGSSKMLQAHLAEKKSSLRADHSGAAQDGKDAYQEMKKQLQDQLQHGQDALNTAVTAMGESAKKGSDRLAQRAHQQLQDARERLSRLQLPTLNVDTAEAAGHLQQLTSNTGEAVGGFPLPLNDLIAELGVLRGVSFARATAHSSLQYYATVAALTPDMVLRKDLRAAIAMVPDVTSQQLSIEQDSAVDIEKANALFTNFGSSSFSSKQNSLAVQAGLSVQSPFASLSVSGGHESQEESEKGKAKEVENQTLKMLGMKIQSLYRSTFYMEPRLQLMIEPGMLDPSPEFQDAVDRISKLRTRNDSSLPNEVWNLFERFGDHVCPQVLLGGWWRITAGYQSLEAHERIDVSKIATAAIEQSHERGQHTSVSAGGGGGSFGVAIAVHAGGSWGDSSSESRLRHNTSADRNINENALKSSEVKVAQEWKGGASGATAATWRASLDDKTNSNWKVIDRQVEKCFAIWEWKWLEEQELLEVKKLLQTQYEQWKLQFTTTTTTTTTHTTKTTSRTTSRTTSSPTTTIATTTLTITVRVHMEKPRIDWSHFDDHNPGRGVAVCKWGITTSCALTSNKDSWEVTLEGGWCYIALRPGGTMDFWPEVVSASCAERPAS